MALDTKPLTPEEEVILRHQGLEEDTRNKISKAFNISNDIEKWEKETDPNTKALLYNRMKKNAKQIKEDMEHIRNAFSLYDCKEKPKKTST